MRSKAVNTVLFILSLLFAIIAAELGLGFFYENRPALSAGHANYFTSFYQFDSKLGWTIKADATGRKWGVEVRTRDYGIRSNGPETVLEKEGPRILAVGDSWTFGDEVGDSMTWLAQLEKKLNESREVGRVQVMNAGISSYGFDQMVLRAEKLVPDLKPDLLMILLISDSVPRCAHTIRYGLAKPYFTVQNGELVLHREHIDEMQMNPLYHAYRWLHRSLFLHLFFRALRIKSWDIALIDDFSTTDATDLNQIGILLVERLSRLSRDYQMPVLLVAAEKWPDEDSDKEFLRYLKQTSVPGITWLDLRGFWQDIEDSEERREKLYNCDGCHLSEEGNRVLMEQLLVLVEELLKPSAKIRNAG